MNWDTKKIFGYFLVCIGLIAIVFALYSVYNVFLNAVNPPEIFFTLKPSKESNRNAK